MKTAPVLTGRDNPTLRCTSALVEVIDDTIAPLCKQMIRIMKTQNGIGLAAPQIGVLQRIIVVTLGKKIYIMINPEILSFSAECETEEEGCLSLPEYFGSVSRSKTIEVSYRDESGKEQKKTLSHLDARVVQHEIDHLNGILFSDREVRHTSASTKHFFL